MHISITGLLGSGKSTYCKMIHEKYGYEIYSTGAVQREVARERGITTLELNRLMENDCTLDHVIDDAVTKISRERSAETLIFDSRMAWHFAYNSFRVFITVDPTVAAERVMMNQRGDEEKYASVEEAREMLIERSHVENQRFREIYGMDYYDKNNFDLIIDSTKRTPEEIVGIIMDNFNIYSGNPEKYERRVYD